VGLVGTNLQGQGRRAQRAGVTRWQKITAAALASEANTGLKTSITDSGDEIQYAGSATSGAFTMGTAYRAQYVIRNPNTGAAVTWSDGDFTGIEVWFKYGSNIPNSNKEGFLVGLVNTGTSKALAVGTSYQTGQHRITSSTFTAVAVVNMTWGADDRVFGMVSAPAQAGTTNVLLDLCNAMQMDDSTSPARVQSAVATSLTLVTSANLVLALGFGGAIDVTVYYRLVKTPVAPV
jgi:hypothetical protein